MTEQINPTDQQLVAAAQSGDFEAFRSIVLRYSNALLAVAFSVVSDFHEAQDVTQESWVKCYHQLHTLKDPNKLGSWLYSIAYRTSLDFAKRKKETVPYNDTIVPQSDHIVGWLDQHFIQQSIGNALNQIEAKSREAIVLHYLSNWTMKEIGHFLQLSVSAVESRIRRGRDVLKHLLADDFEHYFQSHQLGHKFQEEVSGNILKRMGHFYIPVIDRQRTTQWFIDHFQLGVTVHGNLQLESGDILYLLECQTHHPSELPVMTFSVSDIDHLWLQLREDGVTTEPIEMNAWLGHYFLFYDPDGNRFYAAQQKTEPVMTD